MKVFAPNRKNSSCQEMGGHILRCLSMGEPLDEKFRGSGFRVMNYEGWLLFRLLGSKLIG
jgi:hypothetical protein